MNNIDFVIFGAIDWESDWITQHRLVQSLSQNGYRVLFIENTGIRSVKIKDLPRIIERIKNWFKSTRGFRRINQNLTIYSPIILPFPYSKIAKNINSLFFNKILKYWISKNRFNNITYITFLATPLINDFIDNSSHILKIYYSSDNHQTASQNQGFLSSESNIVNSSNAIFVTSQKLKEKFNNQNENIYKFPAGVELKKFKKNNDALPIDLRGIPSPIVGFVGGINNKINIELLLETSKRLKEYSFVMIGEGDDRVKNKLSEIDNIYFLGKKNHLSLSSYIQNFNCGIIPYRINDFTNSVYPSKLNEFLAMGKPIVSTNIYEINFFNKENNNVIDVADTSKEFSNAIRKNVENDNLEKEKIRKSVALNNSWDNRFLNILTVIQKLKENKINYNINWEKNFLTEYNKFKKRVTRISLVLLSIFFIIFISPAPYYLGQTLVLNDKPQKSDVIVGLSGYGQASYVNNSYQQRALDVYYYYSKGFAKKIILSGRKQLIEEFDLMKALLISLGIPKERIILINESSSSTFQNIEKLSLLMKKENFKSANIITGSYHQKRLKFSLGKIFEDEKFYIVQETNNNKQKIWFFQFSKLKVILYEYMSLIYNYFKHAD